MRCLISGGHYDNPQTSWIEDCGATYAGYTEYQICQNIRDEVLKLLPTAIPVPNNLPLKDKINWVNSFCNRDDLLLEIHLNSNANISKQGCEAYYSDSPYLSDIFSKHVSSSLGVANLGSIHDSKTYVGSLGWLRKTNGQSILLEVCYLSNVEDRRKLLMPGGFRKVAEGILNGINEHKANLSMVEYLKQVVYKLMQLIK